MTQHQSALALTHSAPSLAIGLIAIREIDGLFSLNDLHKAGGESPNHKPAFFLRNEQTKALIAEIQVANSQLALKVTHGGANGGTYACRELVIAYAAWISAAFHLKVIRVFLKSTEQQTQPTADPTAALEQALNGGRWFLSADSGRITLKPVRSDAYVISAEQFAEVIREPGQISPRLLPEIIAVAAERLLRINQDTR